MKEAVLYSSSELTRHTASPRLDKGVIFMAEPIVAELPKASQNKATDAPVFTWHVVSFPQEETTAKAAFAPSEQTLPLVVNPEAQLRSSWDTWKKSLPIEQRNDPETAETIRYAIEMGIAPGSPDKDTLDKNAALSDADRLEEARKLLDFEKLTEKQASAVIQAHEVGSGEKGKDRLADAGVHNYTREQLRKKAEILKKAGLTKQQRRILMENAIVGTVAEIPTVTDERLQRVADDIRAKVEAEIDRMGNTDPNLPIEYIEGQIERINRMLDEPKEEDRPNPAEAMDLKNLLRTWGIKTVEAERRAKESEGRAKGERGVLPEAAAIEAYITSRRANPDDGTPGAPRDIELEKQFIKAIKDKMLDPTIPPIGGYHFPTDLLAAAASFKETRDMFLTSVIFKPYDDSTERNQYNIDLYAGDRLKSLLEAIRKDPNLTAEEREREYQQQLGLDTAAELFHTMNGRILAGSLGEFIRVAERIDPKHFALMNNLRGVGQVMRLYEEKYNEHLAKHKVIYDYDAVKADVEKAFREMAKRGFIASGYDTRDTNQLEEWEIKRALHVGRNFTNLMFRGAEYIAQGEIKGNPNDKYASVPQESAVKLLNWIQWVGKRFEVGNARGGPEFLNIVKKRFNEWNREQGKVLGHNKIISFGGRSVEDMQYAEFFGIRGVISGWRLEDMAFPNLQIGNGMTLRQWFDDHHVKEELHEIEEYLTHATHHGHQKASVKDMHHVQHELVKVFTPLVDQMHNGLGALLAHGSISGEKGYLVRKMIWEKVAQTNTPLMISYLRGLKMADGVTVQDLEAIVKATPGNWNDLLVEVVTDSKGNPVKTQDGSPETRQLTRFDKFQEKITYRYQKSVLEAAGSVGADAITVEELTAEEEELERRIKAEAVKLAPHLADVLFPYVPFMNDIPFEVFDYTSGKGPRQEFYKRVVASDYGQYDQAQNGFGAIQDAPAQFTSVDKAVEALKTMEKGMSGPPGPEEGMERCVPVVMAIADFYEVGGYTGDDEKLKKELTDANFLDKQMGLILLKDQFNKITSRAQKYGGKLIESWNEGAMFSYIEKVHAAGVVTHAQVEYVRKKKKFTMGWLLAAIWRDILPFAVAGAVAAIAAEASVEVLGQPSGGGGGGGGHH